MTLFLIPRSGWSKVLSFLSYGLKISRRKMSAINFNALSIDEKKTFFNSFDTVLTDCDGVLWLGGKEIPGASEVMNAFKKMGKGTYYVTNNSTQTRCEFVSKCSRLGFNAVEEEIIGTAWLTAHYLKKINFQKKVYLIASSAVQKELEAVGITALGVGPDPVLPSKVHTLYDLPIGQMDPDVGAVVVGYDLYFSLPKMIRAHTYLNDPECLFIATNTDERFPHSKKNLIWPGTGTFVAAIETGSERKAKVMGKPSTYIMDAILLEKGLDPKRTLMIGDRCNTDIHFGNECNMITLLVLTGVTSLEQLNSFQKNGEKHLLPTYYTTSIEDLKVLFEC